MATDVKIYMTDKSRPENSVHYGKTKRFDKAKEQFKEDSIDKQKIITLIRAYLQECLQEYSVDYLEYLKTLGDEANVVYTDEISTEEFNRNIMKLYSNLNCEKDVLWLKFTNTGHLGVVASSNDVNFDIPPSKDVYDEREKRKWKYSTSGIIVHYVGTEWDTTFFLVFPLPNLPGDKKSRHEIEVGVGNYLIENGIPILDFYSHRI